MAERMHRIWVGFAIDRTLPGPEYNADRRWVYLLDVARTVTQADVPAARHWP